MKRTYIISLAVVLLVTGAFLVLGGDKTDNSDISSNKELSAQKVTVYKSPNCGCCVGYVKALRDEGFEVEIVSREDMVSIKDEHNIPKDMWSCHTSVFDNYFAEGHIPLEAVSKLLAEKPQIDGIALPGMPSGTPGMPGSKRGIYTIHQLTNGEYSEFISI